MKKITILLALALLCSFAACGTNEDLTAKESFGLTETPAGDSKDFEFAPLNSTYYVLEPAIMITVPEDFLVITRAPEIYNSFFDESDANYNTNMAHMIDNDIYLESWDSDGSNQILVAMSPSDDEEYLEKSDFEISESLRREFVEAGMEVTHSSVYMRGDLRFVKVKYVQEVDGITYYSTLYSTITQGKTINIAMHSLYEQGESVDETFLEVINSIKFNVTPMASVYTNPNSGAEFAIPSGWSEAPSKDEGGYWDVEFIYDIDEYYRFVFASTENIEYMGYSLERLRSELEEVYLDTPTYRDVNVSYTKFNGVEYTKVSFTTTLYDEEVWYPMIQLLYLKEDTLYLLQFGGYADSEPYKDFEALVCSAIYK